jgi:hypothetical protein
MVIHVLLIGLPLLCSKTCRFCPVLRQMPAGMIICASNPMSSIVVDPIWLGAQTLMAMELGWAGE